MSEMHIFEKTEFGKVRVVERESEPWFVAKDVCSCLELGNVGQALSYLDVDEKSSIDPNIITADVGFDAMMKDAHTPMRSVIPEAGRGGRPLSLVSEPGLYSLVLRSRKPEAKAFKRWVTHDVIPSIRKRGLYATPHTVEAMLADPDTAIKLLTSLKEERRPCRQSRTGRAESPFCRCRFYLQNIHPHRGYGKNPCSERYQDWTEASLCLPAGTWLSHASRKKQEHPDPAQH